MHLAASVAATCWSPSSRGRARHDGGHRVKRSAEDPKPLLGTGDGIHSPATPHICPANPPKLSSPKAAPRGASSDGLPRSGTISRGIASHSPPRYPPKTNRGSHRASSGNRYTSTSPTSWSPMNGTIPQ